MFAINELKPISELLPKRRRKVIAPSSLESDAPPLSPKDELILDLVRVGVSLRKAEYLVTRFPIERIRRQLSWLPHRGARKPASLLIVAIERNYDAPAYLP